MIEQLATRHILHDHKNITGRIYNLVQFDNVRMAKQLQVLYLAAYFADHVERFYFVSIQNLNSDRVSSELMLGLFDFAKATSTQRLHQDIVAYFDLIRQVLRSAPGCIHRQSSLSHFFL